MTADSNANQNKTDPSNNESQGSKSQGASNGSNGGGGQGGQDGPSPSNGGTGQGGQDGASGSIDASDARNEGGSGHIFAGAGSNAGCSGGDQSGADESQATAFFFAGSTSGSGLLSCDQRIDLLDATGRDSQLGGGIIPIPLKKCDRCHACACTSMFKLLTCPRKRGHGTGHSVNRFDLVTDAHFFRRIGIRS